MGDAAALAAAGVNRVVLGTAAVAEPNLVDAVAAQCDAEAIPDRRDDVETLVRAALGSPSVARTMIDGAPHIVESDREVPRETRHQRVGIAGCDHTGCKYISILVGHTLAVAEKKSIALQPLIQKVRIVDVAVR